ncbi:MAG TPA: hypothetical protein VIH92_00470, partial [Solirubrobacteraceae bacterium]
MLWPVKGAAGIRKQGIEGGAVAALAAVQKLRVHVEGHPAFGVADLVLDVGHVEVGRQEHDRDVGPS